MISKLAISNVSTSFFSDIPAQQSENPPDNIPYGMRPLGRILLEKGSVKRRNLLKALFISHKQKLNLGEILLARGWITEPALFDALAQQWQTSLVDLKNTPPDVRLIDELGINFCLRHNIIPYQRIGNVIFIVTSRPDLFDAAVSLFPPGYGSVRMFVATSACIHTTFMTYRAMALAQYAEQSVVATDSCRTFNRGRIAFGLITLGFCLVIGIILIPGILFTMLVAWMVLTMACTTLLKVVACGAASRERRKNRPGHSPDMVAQQRPEKQLPVISIIVPLLHEADVIEKLIDRLSRLVYPRELTDIVLVVEAIDPEVQSVLNEVDLPYWIRIVTVPRGRIRTKPRAMNYALNFCRGEIVGIWDAEDRPDPFQLHKIAHAFAIADDDVACVQGRLDYFNPRTNFLARCFTIEYAAWFRSNLPGIARLGLIVPLGGTTVFFRRDILETIGGWDAWNVTEDADLGVRLARRGWRTELIDTTTDEEANCRILPWVKQRSRWIKGYAMTWGVHMRRPVKLWRDLGTRRFVAFQVQFLGTLSQYLFAPVLWSFWLPVFGFPLNVFIPFEQGWNNYLISALFLLFFASELTNLAINFWSVRRARHRHLWPWVPLMHFYFPLGCLAGWKAIYEIVTNPYYWDKTVHGIFDEADTRSPPTVRSV